MKNQGKHNLGDVIAQFMKFGIVGFLAFAIDFAVMVLLTELFGVHPVVSTTISFVASLLFNYLASMRFVFKRRDDMGRVRELVTFAVLSLFGLFFNDMLMFAGTELLHVDYRIVKLFSTAVVMVWNFVTRKVFLEAR